MSYSKKRTGRDKFFLLFMIVFALVGGIAIFVGIYQISESMETKHWETTDGVVLHTEIVEQSSGKSHSYKPIVVYEYTVGGRTYNCGTVDHNQMASDYDWARDRIDDHPEGSTVTVHYNPEDPSEAALVVGLSWSDAIPLIIGIVFVLIATVMIWKFR